MKKLSKEEMKKVMGGTEKVGIIDGTCTVYCPSRLKKCSSDHMDCDSEENAAGFTIKIACDGKWLTC